MLRTVIVLGLVVLAIVYVAKDRKDTTAVKRVDSDLALTETQVARVSPFTLLAPTGLPHAWAPTSVSYLATPAADGHLVFHVGWVTPAGKYADLEESDTDVSRVLAVFAGKGSEVQGDIPVAGRQTSLATAPDGTVTLTQKIVEDGKTTYLGVTGGASQSELTQLLTSLRPAT